MRTTWYLDVSAILVDPDEKKNNGAAIRYLSGYLHTRRLMQESWKFFFVFLFVCFLINTYSPHYAQQECHTNDLNWADQTSQAIASFFVYFVLGFLVTIFLIHSTASYCFFFFRMKLHKLRKRKCLPHWAAYNQVISLCLNIMLLCLCSSTTVRSHRVPSASENYNHHHNNHSALGCG